MQSAGLLYISFINNIHHNNTAWDEAYIYLCSFLNPKSLFRMFMIFRMIWIFLFKIFFFCFVSDWTEFIIVFCYLQNYSIIFFLFLICVSIYIKDNNVYEFRNISYCFFIRLTILISFWPISDHLLHRNVML